MEKNDVFEFTAPNGAEVTAVVLEAKNFFTSYDDFAGINYICYAQNRIFHYREELKFVEVEGAKGYPEIQEMLVGHQGDIIVDYAILPDYDKMLEDYNDLQVAQTETACGM